MASSEERSHECEWEYNENEDPVDLNGEEASRGPTINTEAWNRTCKKLQIDVDHHKRHIPLEKALGFKDLTAEEKEAFIKDRRLADEDQLFLSSEDAVKCLRRLSDAVVCVKVRQSATTSSTGTGFFARVNDDEVVITNSHNVRSTTSGNGVDFSTVKPGNVKVAFFYNGNDTVRKTINRNVSKIEMASPPNANKDDHVLQTTMQNSLKREGPDTANVAKCRIAMGFLSSYFDVRDAFLDFVILHLKPLEKDEHKAMFVDLNLLEIKPFKILDNFRNVLTIEVPHPSRSTNPRSLRLFTISHPHSADKRVSFGGMESHLFHVYNLNMCYGQNDTGMLKGKEPIAEHSIPTCHGSSGAPIFFYIFNHNTGEFEIDGNVYFLHFFGVEGALRGKAVPSSIILKNIESQAMHKALAAALAEVDANGSD